MDNADPRMKWRHLHGRIQPEEMVVENDPGGNDSTNAADADATQRETRWLLERGGGFGG
jgi:hypothetical protein